MSRNEIALKFFDKVVERKLSTGNFSFKACIDECFDLADYFLKKEPKKTETKSKHYIF